MTLIFITNFKIAYKRGIQVRKGCPEKSYIDKVIDMNKTFHFLLLGLLALFLAPDDGTAENIRFRVGVSVPLTGAYSEFGAAVNNGIALAKEEQPNLFKSVDFLIDDDRYDPKQAVSNFSKCVDLDKVDLFFAWGNESALSIAPIAERRKMPSVFVAHHPKVAAGLHYVIRFINPAEDYSKAILSYLRKHQLKRIGVIKTEISFFNILLEELKNNLAADESLTEYETFLPAELDFRSAILKLKSKESQFDILGVYLISPQVSRFYRQASEQEFRPRSFGTTVFESKAVIKDSLGLMNGAVYSHISATEEFRERYVRKFGDDIQLSYAANAYDFATLVGRLFGRLESRIDAEGILKAFQREEPGVGASGAREFVSTASLGNFFRFPVVVRRVQGEKIVDAKE